MSDGRSRRGLLKAGLAGLDLGLAALAPGGAPAAAQARIADHGRADAGSHLNKDHVQVLFADLQVSLVATCRTVEPKVLARSAAVLAKVATVLGLPMLFSVVPETGGPPKLIPELEPYATPANTILRKLTGPFINAATANAIAARHRRTLVVAGFASEVVVLQAVLDATLVGYAVEYVVDAVGSQSDRTEAAAFRHIERAGALPTCVLSLTTRMAPDFFHPPGSVRFSALQPLLRP